MDNDVCVHVSLFVTKAQHEGAKLPGFFVCIQKMTHCSFHLGLCSHFGYSNCSVCSSQKM